MPSSQKYANRAQTKEGLRHHNPPNKPTLYATGRLHQAPTPRLLETNSDFIGCSPASASSMTPKINSAAMMRQPEVWGTMQISRSAFFDLLKAGGFAPRAIRIGGLVRYRRDEVLSWIASGCPPTEEWQKTWKPKIDPPADVPAMEEACA